MGYIDRLLEVFGVSLGDDETRPPYGDSEALKTWARKRQEKFRIAAIDEQFKRTGVISSTPISKSEGEFFNLERALEETECKIQALWQSPFKSTESDFQTELRKLSDRKQKIINRQCLLLTRRFASTHADDLTRHDFQLALYLLSDKPLEKLDLFRAVFSQRPSIINEICDKRGKGILVALAQDTSQSETAFEAFFDLIRTHTTIQIDTLQPAPSNSTLLQTALRYQSYASTHLSQAREALILWLIDMSVSNLFNAIEKGDLEQFSTILSAYPPLINHCHKDKGVSVLHHFLLEAPTFLEQEHGEELLDQFVDILTANPEPFWFPLYHKLKGRDPLKIDKDVDLEVLNNLGRLAEHSLHTQAIQRLMKYLVQNFQQQHPKEQDKIKELMEILELRREQLLHPVLVDDPPSQSLSTQQLHKAPATNTFIGTHQQIKREQDLELSCKISATPASLSPQGTPRGSSSSDFSL